MAIGDVSVKVVPDADGFWRDFAARTRGQADEEGRRAGEAFNRGFRGAANPTIRPRIDDAALRAELARLRAEIDRLNSRASSGANSTRQSFSLLGTAIATLAPAAVTIGAAAIGAFAGIIPAAGTAVLAVLGIRDAFKSGALQGTAFMGQVRILQSEFGRLKRIAAGNLIPGLTQAMQSLQPLFGPLNNQIGEFSTQLGQIAAALAPALVGLFTQLQPLFTTFGALLVSGAQHLAAFIAGGNGMNTFIGYVQSTLPQVLSTLGQLVVTIAHVSAALAPLGPVVLSGLGVLARVINAIPLPILTGLATVVLTAYSAFQVFKGVVLIMRAVNLAIEATPIGLIAAAAAAIAVFAFGMNQSASASTAASAANAAFAESVKSSTDAMNAANVAATNKALQDDHAFEALDALHKGNLALAVSYGDLAPAINGSDAAFASLLGKFKGSDVLTKAFVADLKTMRGSLQSNIESQRKFNQAQDQMRGKLAATQHAAAAGGRLFGTTATAYAAAAAAAKKSTLQTDKQTLAFQLENDAASLLQQTLDKMAGRTLNTAQAQTALRQANLGVLKSLHDNGLAIKGGTAKAVANQQALQGQAQSAIAYAEAIGKATGSSKAEVAQLRTSRDAIEANLRQRGKLTPALKSYIDNLYSLSKIHVPPTKLDANVTAAHTKIHILQAEIAGIRQGKVPGISANTAEGQHKILDIQNKIQYLGTHPWAQARIGVRDLATATINAIIGKLNRIGQGATATINAVTPTGVHKLMATGGFITGAGTETSDSIPIMASNHEFVVNARQTRKHRRLLEAINNGVMGYAGGGYVQQEAPIGKGPYKVGSTIYQTYTAAVNAAQRVLTAQLNLKVKIDGSDIPAFARSLSGTVASARSAFWNLLRDAQKGGLSKSAADYLHDEDVKLNQEIAQRNKIAATLAKVNAEIVNVRSAITGSFDITTAGQGASGSGTPTFGSILAQAKQDENRVKQFTAGLRKLAAEGLGTTSLQQLAEAGPSALPQVLALERATPSQIRELNAARTAIYNTGTQLGRLVGDRMYGVNSTALQGQEAALNRQIDALAGRMEGQFERFAAAQANRPVILTANGREIARVVNTENRANQRR